MKRRTIMPGVNLTAVETKKFKTGCMSVNLLRPLCREEAALNALLPSVLIRGTERYPNMAEIARFLDSAYGASVGSLVRKKGEVQTVGFYGDFIGDELAQGEPVLEQMIAFLGECLLHPALQNGALDGKFVESEKLNLVNAIEAKLNDKRSWAMAQLLKAMCDGEAYGIPRLGEREAVEAITAESLTAHWQTILATSRIEIFYLGTASADRVCQLLQAALAGLPRGEQAAAGTVCRPEVGAVRRVEETMEVTQGKLCMGLRTEITAQDPRYPALTLCNAVFGGSVSGKLFRNVREAQSLCYYASSGLEKFKGLMVIQSGVETEQLAVAEAEILRQLDACKAGEITAGELESARKHVRSGLKAGLDSPGRLDDFYLGQTIAGLTETMEQLENRVRSVTLEQVVEAAGTLKLDTVYDLKGVGV